MADLHSEPPGAGMTTTCLLGSRGAGGKLAPLAQLQTRLLEHLRAGGKTRPLPVMLRRCVPLCSRVGGKLDRLPQMLLPL